MEKGSMDKTTHSYVGTVKLKSGETMVFELTAREESLEYCCRTLVSTPWVAVPAIDGRTLIINASEVEYFTVKEVTK